MSKQLATTGGDLTPPPLSYGDPGSRHVTAHLLALLYIELRDMFEWVPTDEIFKAIAQSATTDYKVTRDLAIARLKSLPSDNREIIRAKVRLCGLVKRPIIESI
ncbi:uncharacterized protein EV422DRAFT_570665 [Fimicolochytrium jonesii]|uniref:uncharacterized protein n=1 Tax=Fimicolochytrium jonesii TaxID=1396493 RepID=UPI0022FEC6B7|nr:uncharacterized protein EV422DRAFT_570665 [Fimicolochytrium jonesii]KAI8817623.1 hypothetical protein EV422DRAFT_570665 [Fimicolochytrium jonesii]